MYEENDDSGLPLSRRGALKTGAAVAAGAIVWSEPTLKGLVRRPAYAATGSTATVFNVPALPRERFFQDDGLPLVIFTDGGFQLELTGPGVGGSNPNTAGGGTYTLTASLAGCICTIDPAAAGTSIERDVSNDNNDRPPVFGVVGTDTVTYAWPNDARANTFNFVPFTVTCVPA